MKDFLNNKIVARLKSDRKLLIAAIFVLIVLIELVLILSPRINIFQGKLSLEKYADQVMEECDDSSYVIGCYDQEIPKLMEYISMEEAFEVAKIIQEQDFRYGYCHVLGHNLSAVETSKDVSKWKEVINRCPRGICSNGCLHGAAQERFRDNVLSQEQLDELKRELIGVCDDTDEHKLTGLERAECYHGLGHLTMYVTGADMNESVEICDIIAVSSSGDDYTSLCYEGLFMQLFQPLDVEDEVLVEGMAPETTEAARPFCEGFGETEVVEACWSQVHPLFRERLSTPEGILEYCSQSDQDYKMHCYSMSFWGEAQGTNYDADKLGALCEAMPLDIRGYCFGNMSNAIIHGSFRNIEMAVGFCESASSLEVQNGCYERILKMSTYNLPTLSPEFERLCAAMPDRYKDECLALNE